MIRVCFANAWHKTCTIYLSMYMLSCDSLFILSHRFQFVKTFLKVFLKKFLTSSQPEHFSSPCSLALSTDDLIIIHSITPFVNTFFHFFWTFFHCTIYCGLFLIIYTICIDYNKKKNCNKLLQFSKNYFLP